MRRFLPEEFRGWTLSDSVQVYDRETIFDFINGAGEVYLSYGMDSVCVFRYAKPSAPEIQVELYDMGSAEDAYGVFTVARERELQGIGNAYDQHGGLLCFWQERWFVCLTAQAAAEGIAEDIKALAGTVSAAMPTGGSVPVLVACLPAEQLDAGSVRFVHLHSSVNYYYYLAESNILDLDRHTNVVMGAYDTTGTHLVLIEYPQAERALAARRSFAEHYAPELLDAPAAQLESGRWVAAAQSERFVAIALDAVSEAYALHLVQAALEQTAAKTTP